MKPHVAGSDGKELWIATQRAPEESGRIKAVVLTKDFVEKYKATGARLARQGLCRPF